RHPVVRREQTSPWKHSASSPAWHMIATATTTGTVAAGWPGSSGSAVRHAQAGALVTTITAGGASGGGGAPRRPAPPRAPPPGLSRHAGQPRRCVVVEAQRDREQLKRAGVGATHPAVFQVAHGPDADVGFFTQLLLGKAGGYPVPPDQLSGPGTSGVDLVHSC